MSQTYSGSSIPVGFQHHEKKHTSQTAIPTQPSTSGLDDESSLLNCALAGGFGGAIADSLMHSLDTVKTRQQGAPSMAKFNTTIGAYRTILREEGFARGLYGGYTAALGGSFPSTAIFFVTYESTKRKMINEWGVNDSVAYLTAGFLGDFAASFWYVPSEVLKTRLQLQGRYNNPHFKSGYNYRGLGDALRTIVTQEGSSTLFYGYKHTLARDLPFSALQFAFYEKFRQLAFDFSKPAGAPAKIQDAELSIVHELATGAAAGGLAGIITTPLDVIKTRIQTQNPNATSKTATPKSAKPSLITTTSVTKGLLMVYRAEGVPGLFGGVGPRLIWTSIQSSIMLLLYQVTLRNLDACFDGVPKFE
ncbi:hypothetical protein BABINDRAFT_160777 [Babjeviella inositovora NRRL Y-12698]|uniref:Mitochondrial carrier protein n=1 Tax=Babjeviella inositovora NRRL Y-12698 TaxID=984486 RepID=A0A1E3QS24_9ASCO|nr:uncharacterized protein BABINDRAFT_160777 [Babjeviella inositovora NRRL Y-12698]ODQ80503.1 hypothetical protein BABINDRAFT_160777 [Babjeviella inositovora NRRL Y-12698]